MDSESDSEIQNFFSGATVFLTGATGYIGKLLLEKLLRCTEVGRIYILVRTKKDQHPDERLKKLFDCPSFGPLKELKPNFKERIHLFYGDCNLPNLGLNENYIEQITNEVSIFFHLAATVRFDQKISTATNINVRATRDILKIARRTKNLKTFVYISTAYSHCPRNEIDEQFYEPKIDGDKLIQAVEALDDDLLNAMEKTLLDKWPNTYSFTKSVAEDMVRKEGKGLPVAVVRPSIVTSTKTEPIPGFIDNIYGVTGIITACGLGLLHVIPGKSSNITDIIPADYVVNNIIAVAWATDYNREKYKVDDQIPIFNCVTSTQKPITWAEMSNKSDKAYEKIRSPKAIWVPFYFFQSNPVLVKLLSFLLHTLPAHIVDIFARCLGKKPMMVEMYQKINKFTDVISYFITNQWKFSNENTKSLTKTMSSKDKKLFNFDVENLDWNEYFPDYAKGIRIHVIKDPLDTIPEGEKYMEKLFFYNKMLIALFSIVIFYVFMKIMSYVIN